MMFRESMRISTTNLHETLKPVEEKDRLKKVLILGQNGLKKGSKWVQMGSKWN